MKLSAILSLPLFILTASGSHIPLQERQAATHITTIPITTPTPTPTLIDIKSKDLPSWTISVNTWQTAKPIPGGSLDVTLKQTTWISNFRPTQNLTPAQILKILKKVSTTNYCAVYDYGININIEALLYFVNKACAGAFPVSTTAYWIGQSTYFTYTYCSPPTTGTQPNTRVARCINFSFSPNYIQNAQSLFSFTSQELCKAAYAKAINFCAKEIYEGRFLGGATELSGGISFSIGTYENFLPLTKAKRGEGLNERGMPIDQIESD